MPKDLVEKNIPIVNMDCASCAKTIEKELIKVPGIKEIKASILLKKAFVKYEPDSIDMAEIEKRIEKIGYRIGYKKYEGTFDRILRVIKAKELEGLRTLSDQEFEEYVLKAKHPVLVEFATASCPSCNFLSRTLKEIERNYKDDVYIYRVNIDSSNLWKDFDIMSSPTILYFKNGKDVFRQIGLPNKKEIIDQIEKLIE